MFYAFIASSLVALIFLLLFRVGGKAKGPEIQFLISPSEKNLFASFAISPDGRAIALAAERDGVSQLLLRRLDSTGTAVLDDTQGAEYPFWSSDSQHIGFFAGGKLKRVPAAGGAPQVICDAPKGNGGTWNATDTIVFTPGIFDGLYRVPAGGGLPESITTLSREQEENSHRWPYFLPDGRRFLFMIRSTRSGIYLGELGSKKITRLLDASSSAIYSKGHLLFSRRGELMAQPFDLKAGRVTGEAFIRVKGVGAHALRNAGFFSATMDGDLVVRQASQGDVMREVVFIDRRGFQHGEARFKDTYQALSLSPNGRTAAFHRFTEGDRTEIWLMELQRDRSRRFALDSAFPVWSRDGESLLMMAFKEGRFCLYSKSVRNGRESGWLVASSESKIPLDWSPDGRFLLYEQQSPATKNDLLVVRSDGSGGPIPIINSTSNEAEGRLSPDGRWIAYTSDESGHPEIYVRSLRIEMERSAVAGFAARWREAELVG